MIRDALAWARGEGETLPDEIEAARLIGRFGVQAVYGRTLGYGEARRIAIAEGLIDAYKSRAAYRDESEVENWAEWSARYPEMSARLIAAEIIDNADNNMGG